MCESKIKQCIEIALKNENFDNYTVEIQGNTDKGDGYIGNITFITVSGKTKNGTNKTLDLVTKASKDSTNLRTQVPIKEAFEKEIFIYDQVKTTFEDFQKEQGIEDLVQVTPRCYATYKTEAFELLIFENLRTMGYGLWDKKIPMSFEHLKMVLKAYGKWHALSFALKKKNPNTFEKLTENNVNVFCEFIVRMKMIDYGLETFNKSKENLAINDNKLNFNRDDIEYIFTDLFFEEPEYHVILHGDCWNNNFMFKYEENLTKPLDIRILDWQCSGLGSPAIDLSHFLYCCCSKENFENFNELLGIYYSSLSRQLRKLGVDPEEVYSYSTFTRHWRRFSRFGIVVAAFALRFSLCEKEDAPDFEEAAKSEETFLDSFNIKLKNEDAYLERVKYNLLHYVQSC